MTALENLRSGIVTPDVVFLDLNMPAMNGRQFLTIIKADDTLKHIPVIIFSTSSQLETIEETKKLGAYVFITKPNSFSELKRILSQFIN